MYASLCRLYCSQAHKFSSSTAIAQSSGRHRGFEGNVIYPIPTTNISLRNAFYSVVWESSSGTVPRSERSGGADGVKSWWRTHGMVTGDETRIRVTMKASELRRDAWTSVVKVSCMSLRL